MSGAPDLLPQRILLKYRGNPEAGPTSCLPDNGSSEMNDWLDKDVG